MLSTFAEVQALAEIIPEYRALRTEHPLVPARTVHAYVRCADGVSFKEFCCPAHKWVFTGSGYGGEDDSYHGEGRCYCSLCGADGDA